MLKEHKHWLLQPDSQTQVPGHICPHPARDLQILTPSTFPPPASLHFLFLLTPLFQEH